MLLAVLVFVVVVGAIVGGYLAFSALPGVVKQKQLEKRLREISAPIKQTGGADSILVKTDSDALFDRMAAGTRGVRRSPA
jgi:hypothetical protein